LRSVLPCRVQVTASMHPLFGELLAATGFKRWNGVPLLVVTRPDGSRETIRADATDIFATDSVEPTCRVLAGPGAARRWWRRRQKVRRATAGRPEAATRWAARTNQPTYPKSTLLPPSEFVRPPAPYLDIEASVVFTNPAVNR